MKDKAVKALQDIERKHHSTVTDFDPDLLVVPPKPAQAGPNVLFSKKYIVATAAIWCTYFVGQFCVYGMNAWIPTWFQAMGYTPAQSVNLQTWNNFAAILSNVSVGFVFSHAHLHPAAADALLGRHQIHVRQCDGAVLNPGI